MFLAKNQILMKKQNKLKIMEKWIGKGKKRRPKHEKDKLVRNEYVKIIIEEKNKNV